MSERNSLKILRVLMFSCALSLGLAATGCGSSQDTADGEGSGSEATIDDGSEMGSEMDSGEGSMEGDSGEAAGDMGEDMAEAGSDEGAEDVTEAAVPDQPTKAEFSAEELAEAKRKVLLQRGREAFDAGNLGTALKYAELLGEEFPGDSDANAFRAEVRDAAANTTTGTKTNAESDVALTQQEAEREAEKLLQTAQSQEDNHEWSQAARTYEKLLQLIKYAPYRAELKEKYQQRAEAGRRNAQVEEVRESDRLEREQKMDAARREQLTKMAAEQRKSETVVRLWREALYNMDLKRFDEARTLVQRVLNIDPNFQQAEELLIQIDNNSLENLRRETYEARMLGYRVALLQLKQSMIPDTRVVVYPNGEPARMIRDRKNKLTDAVRLPKEQAALQAALESKVIPDFTFDEAPLSEVINRIQNEANINILLNEDVEADETVTVELHNLSLQACLNIVLDMKDLRQVYNEGVIEIVGEGTEVRSKVVTRVHDIRDITYIIGEFKAPTLNLRESTGNITIDYGTTVGGEPPTIDEVIDMVELGVATDTWEETGIMKAFGGQLIVTNTPEVQAQVRDFLNSLRRVAGLLVSMEVRFITVTDDMLSDFGVDFRGLGGPSSVPNQANLILEDIRSQEEDNAGGAFDNGALGVPTANPSAGIFFNSDDPQGPVNFNKDIRGRFENIFDNALGNRLSNIGGLAMQVAIFKDLTQINMVIQAVQKRGKGRVLVAPRLSAYNSQRANIAIINQIPYIQDFEVQTAANAAIANPVIDTILDGVVMEVKPTISNDRRFITVEAQPTIADLLLPIPTFVTVLGPSSAVTIQIPELRIQSAKTTVRVPDGGAVVLGGLKSVRDVDRESTTPILGDLPLIGFLFRRKGRSKEKENLVIVLKATVVDLNDMELQQPGWAE